MPTTPSPTAAEPPRSHGLVAALRTLAAPMHFTPRAPSLSAVPFAAPRPGVPARADVYLPDDAAAAGSAPFPSVVVVHGGGFVIGSRTMKPMRLVCTRLAEAGVAAVPIDYRMIGRGGGLTEALTDTVDAFRWWQLFGPSFGADPARMSIMGLSAGATLACTRSGVCCEWCNTASKRSAAKSCARAPARAVCNRAGSVNRVAKSVACNMRRDRPRALSSAVFTYTTAPLVSMTATRVERTSSAW